MAFTIIYHKTGFLGIPAFSGIQPVPTSLSYQMLMQNSTPKSLGIPFPATGGRGEGQPEKGHLCQKQRGRDGSGKSEAQW